MRGGFALVFGLAGCAFQPGGATSSGDAGHGGGTGSSTDATAIRDGAALAPDAFAYRDAPAVRGSLAVTAAALSDGDVTLSTGTLDWAHWGMTSATSFDHESGAGLISDITLTGATATEIFNITATASWTGGTPDASANQTGTGEGTDYPGVQTFTVAAGTQPHTLVVYLGGRDSRGQLDVSLSDASATPYSNNSFTSAGAYHGKYTIVYNASSDGQTLSVSWTNQTSGGQYSMIMSATLK
ncbi:MAG TPA: hypothetical protein VGF94_11880 [Kofleriaceae bacterium]|jgi:hypothetical protein